MSIVNMRTRVVLKRNVGEDIVLWVKDGGLGYAGREICYALKDMLESFSKNDVIVMIESIVMMDKEEYSDMEIAYGFDLGDIDRLIYGHVDWFNDTTSDVDTMYVIDMYNDVVFCKGINKQEAFTVLTLDGICNGITFCDNIVLHKSKHTGFKV